MAHRQAQIVTIILSLSIGQILLVAIFTQELFWYIIGATFLPLLVTTSFLTSLILTIISHQWDKTFFTTLLAATIPLIITLHLLLELITTNSWPAF